MGAAEVIGRVLRPESAIWSRVSVVQVLGEAPVRIDWITKKVAGLVFQGAHSFYTGVDDVISGSSCRDSLVVFMGSPPLRAVTSS
ncbi:hypothetical protein D9M71_642640 [compost metagenome]